MEHELHVNGLIYVLEWRGAPSFSKDPKGHVRTDCILDFGYWVGADDIMIAGKADGPDPVAMLMAAEALRDLDASFEKIKATYSHFKIADHMIEEEDEWLYHAISIPYQTLDNCWFVTFMSDYGATQDFCFRKPEGATEVLVDGYEYGSFRCRISSVRYCVNELYPQCMGDQDFAALVERIRRERLVGPELIEPLLRLLAKETLGVKEDTVKHLRKLLTRDPVTHKREMEAWQRERERKTQEALKRDTKEGKSDRH